MLEGLPIPEIPDWVASNLSILGLFRSVENDEISQFLDDLLDACVMECYFRDHMQEHDLLFHADLSELLVGFDPKARKVEQLKFLEHFYQTANAPDHPIRNRLLRLTADSPDLLAVIKEHGAV